MYLSLLFWLALLLPGYVTVRWVSADDLKSGLLGTIALAYLGTFALLSPVSIACYLLHAPLWVFSGTCVVVIVAGVIEITRRGWWRDVGRLLVGGASIELLIVAADMVLGARVGAITGGDSVVHLTRVRCLLEHGFSNYDPFVAERFFFPIYHTSLHHALYAACCQISGVHHLSVWFASLPWAKLLIASGVYYMVWCIYARQWVAWVAAVFTIGCFGPTIFAVYPNKLAPYWLVPLAIGFAIQACRSPCSWKSPLKLGIASLVLGQVHCLYGAFAGVVLGPSLCVVALLRIVRRSEDRWRLTACVAALATALPFLLVSKSAAASGSHTSGTAEATADQREASEQGQKSWVTMGPRAGWGTVRNWRAACLAVGIVAALLGSRRKQAGLFLAIAGTAALIFYVPPLCAAALAVFDSEWILRRMGFVLMLGFVGLVPASIAFLVEPKTRFWWVRSIVSVLVLLSAYPFSPGKHPYNWPKYWETARKSASERQSYITDTGKVTAFCDKYIRRGATVLLSPWPGMVLTMVHDCHIVAPKKSAGIKDMRRRRRDLRAMLAPDTPWEVRRGLLRKYDVEYFFPAGEPIGWTRGHVRLTRTEGRDFRLFVLDTD